MTGFSASSESPLGQGVLSGNREEIVKADPAHQTLTIDTESEAGSYEKALLYPPFTQITDDTWTNGFVSGVTTQSERKPR